MGTSAARLTTFPRWIGSDRTRAAFVFAVGTTLFSVLVVGVALARIALPMSASVANRADQLALLAGANADVDARSKIYSADGHLLALLHGEENREPVSLAETPMQFREAVIAIEDKRFYLYDGVDLTALGRAFVVNAAGGEIE